jgi:Lipocalin-like domain
MTSNPLVGTWRLISWETRSVDGQKISYPLGKDAVGYIMYNEDGYMSVAIMRPNRVRIAAGDLLGGVLRRKCKPLIPTCPTAVGTNSGEAQSSITWI